MLKSTSVLRFSILAAISAGLVFAQASKTESGPTSISVTGDVTTPLTLNADDLMKMPRETVTVEDSDGAKTQYEGVPLREVLLKAGAPLGSKLRGKALSTYVLARAHDGYQVLFALGELDASFGNAKILIADKRDGKALFGYQGPYRLVCPNDKAGARSVRMLEAIQLVQLQK